MSSSNTKVRSPNSTLSIVTISHVMQHIYVGVSILFPLIMYDLKLSYTEFGIVIAISSFIGGFPQIFVGMLSRKVARHFLMGFGNILLSAGIFFGGLANSFITLLSSRLLSNLGVTPQHPMGTAIISDKFDDKSVGKAIGIHYGLAYIGNIIGSILLTYLAVNMGWRNVLLFWRFRFYL